MADGGAEARGGAATGEQDRRAAASGGRVPDFFIVGHPKSGTTSLFRMLGRHPQLFMPMKETRYFAPQRRSGMERFGPDQAPRDQDAYHALFAGARADQKIGEASPTYLRSASAAGAIASAQPGARIIAILREPADFLRSLHLQFVHNYSETQKDFRKAIELEPARREGKRIPRLTRNAKGLLYSDHVRYVEQLRRFYDVFPPEQVLVLIYDDFRADNEGTVRRVLRFLEVDDAEIPVQAEDSGTLPGVRFLTLHQLTRVVTVARRNPNARSPLLRATNLLLPPRLHSERFQRLWRRLVYTEAKRPDEQFMAELRRRFKPEVEAASEYLGRDLVTLWGYDRIS
ncbi:MAG TPA: sulfotransferase [Solirubrobacteraceae bacterium]|nr:sulfotransferase [Solirubrobacteraceae bacterium]